MPRLQRRVPLLSQPQTRSSDLTVVDFSALFQQAQPHFEPPPAGRSESLSVVQLPGPAAEPPAYAQIQQQHTGGDTMTEFPPQPVEDGRWDPFSLWGLRDTMLPPAYQPASLPSHHSLAPPSAPPPIWSQASVASEAGSSKLCVFCLTAERTVRLEPCGHGVLCEQCYQSIMARTQSCPVCRTPISGQAVGGRVQHEATFIDAETRRATTRFSAAASLRQARSSVRSSIREQSFLAVLPMRPSWWDEVRAGTRSPCAVIWDIFRMLLLIGLIGGFLTLWIYPSVQHELARDKHRYRGWDKVQCTVVQQTCRARCFSDECKHADGCESQRNFAAGATLSDNCQWVTAWGRELAVQAEDVESECRSAFDVSITYQLPSIVGAGSSGTRSVEHTCGGGDDDNQDRLGKMLCLPSFGLEADCVSDSMRARAHCGCEFLC